MEPDTLQIHKEIVHLIDKNGVVEAPYTTDYVFAFRVVKIMRENGWFFSMRDIGDVGAGARFSCPLGPCKSHGNSECDWHGAEVEAKTDCLAICLAAIEAVKRPSEQYRKSLLFEFFQKTN